MPSREQLLQELNRRSGSSMQQPSEDQASQQHESPGFMNAINKFNKGVESAGLPSLGGGFLQGLGNSGISALNLIPKIAGSEARIPHLDLQKYIQNQNLPNKIMFKGGEVGGQLAAGAGAYQKLGNIPRPSGLTGLAADSAKGAATGYALGEDEEGDRGMATAFGAALGPIGSASKGAIGNRITKDMASAKKQYNKLYEGLFKEGEAEGLNSFLKVPSRVNPKQFKKIDEKYTQAFKEAIKDPTLAKVHKAQSKLGKYVFDKEKIINRGGAVNEEALNLARKLEEGLEKTLSKSLSKSKQGLGEKYNAIQSGYKSDVIPYTKNAAIQEFKAGDSEASDLIKSLRGSGKSGKSFRSHLKDKYPEIGLNKGVDLGSKIGLGGAGAFGVGKTALDYFRDYFSDMSGHGEHE